MLEKISLILDRIQQLSFLINYYKLENKIPSHMMMYVEDDTSKCLKAYLEIIKKLKNIAGNKESHHNAIELCLFKHQFVVNHMDL
jgi:predicted house-cleaning noncanonical NTP pyrophosphatase (MazG superfamily)